MVETDNNKTSIQERARFDFVRYANCWEDSDVLLKALALKKDGHYLSIASAGDNSLALLIGSPALVIAADLNPSQLACLELRMAAFAELSYEEVLWLLGIRSGADRWTLFERIKGRLSNDARRYWENRQAIVEQGAALHGKFEHYFQLFRTRVLPLVHSRPRVEELLADKPAAERERFYNATWNNWRWKLLFRIFFSRTLMGRLGRDKEFFRYVEGDVAQRILTRTRYALTRLDTHRNPYLTFILHGNYGETLPTYLRREHFETIRANLSRLKVFQGSIADAIQAHAGVRFDGFNLSDIFEYMNEDLYRGMLRHLVEVSADQARLVYWNMLVDRGYSETFDGRLRPRRDVADPLFLEDQAFFYKRLVVEEVTR